MALVEANGQTVYDFQMRRPRVGAWHADMRVDTPDEIAGPVTIVIDDGARVYKGTASRSVEFVESAQVRVVAGAGGLGVTASPKHYNSTTVRIVLGDLLRDAGEALSSTADSAVLGIALASWTTTPIPVGAVLAALMQTAAPAAAWRMLEDGSMWVGNETWPAAGVDVTTYQVMDQAAEEATMLVRVDAPLVNPGTVFEGRRVSYVQDDVPHIAPVEQRIWFEDEAVTDVARMRAAFAALVRATPVAMSYLGRYWAKVVAQDGGTIDVVLEDFPDLDMGRVQLALPAGMSVDGLVGGRVLVGWAGNPARAYAEGFQGGVLGESVIDAATVYLGGKAGAQSAVNGEALMTYLTALAGSVPTTPPDPTTLLARKTKVS